MELKLFRFIGNVEYSICVGVQKDSDYYRPYKYLDRDYDISERDFEYESKSKYRGIRWQYKSLEHTNWLSKLFHCKEKLRVRTVELHEDEETIFAYPTPDYKYIVAVYSGISRKFSMPNNAVVYNLDGSIHKVLAPPKLINEHWNGNSKPGKCFFSVSWDVKDGEKILCLHIAAGFDWVEVRELDVEMGEFCSDWSRIYRL